LRHGRATPIISCICRISQTIYTNHTEIRENGINGLITFDCHVEIFINFEIYRKGHYSLLSSTHVLFPLYKYMMKTSTQVGYIG